MEGQREGHFSPLFWGQATSWNPEVFRVSSHSEGEPRRPLLTETPWSCREQRPSGCSESPVRCAQTGRSHSDLAQISSHTLTSLPLSGPLGPSPWLPSLRCSPSTAHGASHTCHSFWNLPQVTGKGGVQCIPLGPEPPRLEHKHVIQPWSPSRRPT